VPTFAQSIGIDSGARGDCVGNWKARDGRECFSEAESQTLDQLVPVMTANGTFCPEHQPIVGAWVVRATRDCRRVDVFYGQTAVADEVENLRLDRESPGGLRSHVSKEPRR
jgi:hypothetical protein